MVMHGHVEQVEEDEEAKLQAEEDGFDLNRADDQRSDRLKTSTVEPRVMRSSSSSFARFTARPLTETPLVDSRSTIQ